MLGVSCEFYFYKFKHITDFLSHCKYINSDKMLEILRCIYTTGKKQLGKILLMCNHV